MPKMTVRRAMRKNCLECRENFKEVKECDIESCRMWKYRLGKGRPSVKTVRRNCVECMGGSFDLVKNCVSEGCAFHQYRMGRIPGRVGRVRNVHVDIAIEEVAIEMFDDL